MNRLRSVLAGAPFQVLVFLLGCVLFGWPLLTVADRPGDPGLLHYLYGSWAALIALLAAVARATAGAGRASGDDVDGGNAASFPRDTGASCASGTASSAANDGDRP